MPIEKRGCTEAEWAVANCGKNHMCMVDTNGNKDCDMCKMGFEMREGECVDINECERLEMNMCDKNANCNNLMGTYACQCMKGFRGNGYMCDDEDECMMAPCHPQAECRNTVGSFECQCPEGFEGDGIKTCLNPLERSCKEMERFCGRTNHTACLSVRVFNDSLTSICECEPNYRYNKITKQCEDIDECSENRHNCDPASSTCVNEDGGYRCECLEGYEGTGGICVDIDECERGVAGCHSMAICINQPGSCGCKCIHGFTGDGTQCNAMGQRSSNSCTPEWQRLCRLENKKCHVDDEDVPQCGSCIEDHHPINGTCQPVQNGGNCADPAKNNCDVNAECIDVHPGHHFCTCKVGYIGDGMRCDGPNCHLDAELCHSNAECMTAGNCKCRDGFEGDGIHNCTQITSLSFMVTSSVVASAASKPTEDSLTTDGKKAVELIAGKSIEQPSTASIPPSEHVTEQPSPKSLGIGSGQSASSAVKTPSHDNLSTTEEMETASSEWQAHLTTSIAEFPGKANVVNVVTPATTGESNTTDILETTSGTRLHSTTEDDLSVIIQSFEKTTGVSNELLRRESGPCSSSDRSMCHQLAICEIATGSCRCKDGYTGDGYTNCTKFTPPDCTLDPKLCHANAHCDRHARQCACRIGYIGDGFECNPDPQDCIIRKNLCSPEAICTGRRCKCVDGFTGDGVKCVSVYQRSVNCSECDVNAHCSNGVCHCNIGYFGNGLCCVPDPRDCVHFPGVCNAVATCDKENRLCKCNSGFLGDGISCFPVRSCRYDPNVCHDHAVCLPSGQCICKHGFRGNGYECSRITPLLRHDIGDVLNSCGNHCDKETQLCIDGQCVCKHGYVDDTNGNCIDVNECFFSPCHHLATCTNLPGSFVCTCPAEYVGDGKTCIQLLRVGELGVFCEPDGMTLVLSNDTTAFEGRIFVRGQVDNPHCSKTFSALEHASKPYMFKVAFEHCNVRLEDDDTFATTVIVQKHPMFITTAADAYDLRCRYPLGVKEVESHVNVSDLTTSSTLTDNTHGPNCRLAITNEANESIAAAVVGQALRLRLEVSPNETYSILPRNCFAINIETGERYSLTDNAGCAIDNQLFPEWTRVRPSITEAVFRTFKWPDSSMIRFQCDCSACVGTCPELNCGLRRSSTTRRFRFRRIRHIGNETEIGEVSNDSDYEEDEGKKELFKKLVSSNRLAFSSLVKIRDGEEESRIQEQVDHWKMGSSQQEVLKEPRRSDATLVCVQTAVAFGICIMTLICLGAFVYTFTRRPLCKANVLFPSTVFSILL